MARKRFSDLERVYDALKLAKVDIKTLPQKLDIAKYANWKEGETVRDKITRPDLDGSVIVGVLAFGLKFENDDNGFLIKTNNRVLTQFNSSLGILGVQKIPQAGYIKNGSFTPAKITFTKKGAKTDATSDITGRKYKKNTGNGYTLPFGPTVANKEYLAALNAIVANTAFSGYSYTAKPEQWRRD